MSFIMWVELSAAVGVQNGVKPVFTMSKMLPILSCCKEVLFVVHLLLCGGLSKGQDLGRQSLLLVPTQQVWL